MQKARKEETHTEVSGLEPALGHPEKTREREQEGAREPGAAREAEGGARPRSGLHGDRQAGAGPHEVAQGVPGGLSERAETNRYVVFEDAARREVYLDQQRNLSDNWNGEGRFSKLTVFDTQAEAEAYVARRQQEMGAGR